MRKMTMMLMLSVAVLLVAATAQAAFITGVTIEDFSNEQNNTQFAANNIINGNGFNATAGTHTSAWDPNNWQTGSGEADEWITFDLGAAYDLESVSIWNFNRGGYTNLGIAQMDVLVSSDNTNWTTVLTDQTLTQASGLNTYAGEVVTLSATGVRYVKFDVDTIFNSSPGGPQVGLSEVRFVPEPATMSLLGIGGLLALVRRRRK